MSIIKIKHEDLTENLVGALAALVKLWPGEIEMKDYLEISCETQRASIAVSAIAGELLDDDPETGHTAASEIKAIKAGNESLRKVMAKDPEPDKDQTHSNPQMEPIVITTNDKWPPELLGIQTLGSADPLFFDSLPESTTNGTRHCDVCKNLFVPKRADSKYCSKACAQKDYSAKYAAKKAVHQMGADVDQERETARMITSARSGQLHGRKL